MITLRKRIMDIDALRAICKKLPGVTEDIKWGNDLCFCIAGKMFFHIIYCNDLIF